MNALNKSRCRAFTLVEVMIAFAIFGMLVAAIYSTWVLILRAKKIGNDAAAQVQRERIAVRTLEDSLTCIQSYQASLAYYYFFVQNGEQPMLSFVSRVPAVFPRNGRFGDFNLRRLTFTLEAGPDAEKNLVLRQNPILMDMDSDEQSTPLVLARNVQDFIVECWDTNALAWTGEWTDTNTIPPLLRVSLVLGSTDDPGNKSSALTVTRLIAIPSMMLPGSPTRTTRCGGFWENRAVEGSILIIREVRVVRVAKTDREIGGVQADQMVPVGPEALAVLTDREAGHENLRPPPASRHGAHHGHDRHLRAVSPGGGLRALHESRNPSRPKCGFGSAIALAGTLRRGARALCPVAAIDHPQ